MVAMAVFKLIHIPPVESFVNVMVEPIHTVLLPVIEANKGNAFTTIDFVIVSELQPATFVR